MVIPKSVRYSKRGLNELSIFDLRADSPLGFSLFISFIVLVYGDPCGTKKASKTNFGLEYQSRM